MSTAVDFVHIASTIQLSIHSYAHLYTAPMDSPSTRSPAPPASPIRRWIEAVVPAHVLDFWGTTVSARWRWNQAAAVIVERRRVSATAVALRLRPNRHWDGLTAGQHVNVTVEVDGRRVTRCYSPSAVPGRPGLIEITVKAMTGGRLSMHLVDDARVGDVVELGERFGEMTLDAADARPLTLLAAGSGITPMLALLRERAVRPDSSPVTLHYWAARRAEFCHLDELRGLASAHGWLDVRFHLTREPAAATDETAGRIAAASFRDGVRALAGHAVFACGPHGFVEAARELVADHAALFRAESFSPLSLPTVGVDGAEVAVTLARSGRTVSVPTGQPLLVALESLGMKLPSGCRRGICNTCACGKRTGVSTDLATGATTDEPLSALRLCVSAATSDLVLEL